MAIMLPSFREERAATYSPFLPVHPRTGIVMQVPIEAIDAATGTLIWRDPDTQERFETPSPAAPASCNGNRIGRCAGYALKVDL